MIKYVVDMVGVIFVLFGLFWFDWVIDCYIDIVSWVWVCVWVKLIELDVFIVLYELMGYSKKVLKVVYEVIKGVMWFIIVLFDYFDEVIVGMLGMVCVDLMLDYVCGVVDEVLL